jgi:isopentenyldiphosphate isomerase
MEEYLDIVDENDNIVGKDTRHNVHARYEIHRGVHIFVINSKGEILLQKRSKDKDYYPSFYDSSIGAQVMSGEEYEHAAIREAEEELGFIPKNLEKICDYNSYSKRQREKRRLFVCNSDGPFKIDESEIELIAWFSQDKIIKEIRNKMTKFTEGFKISFNKYLNYKDLPTEHKGI